MILITGGTGIVGARLAFDLINKGCAVRCTKRTSSDIDFVKQAFRFYDTDKGEKLFNRIEWVEADLLDVFQLEKSLKKVKTVYHTAALVSYQKKDKQELLEANVRGTANLVNVCLESGIHNFCHLSSVAALGVPHETGFSDEKSKWSKNQIRSNYALSKYLSEKEVWRGGGEGLNIVIVNPSIILGPAKPHQSSGSFMNLLKKGINYYPPGSTGFVDVRDVSRYSIDLVEKEAYGERFVLNSENLSYKSILELASEIYHNPPPKFKVGSLALELGRIAELLKSILVNTDPKITRETARSSVQTNLFSSDKIKSALDADFIPVRESLKYYSSFRV